MSKRLYSKETDGICKIIDSRNYTKYPLASEEEFIVMSQMFSKDTSRVHIFPFVRDSFLKDSYAKDLSGSDKEAFVDMYVWDTMLFPYSYKRFVICDGGRLADKDEEEFLNYIDNDFLSIGHEAFKKFNDRVRNTFAKWNYTGYFYEHIKIAFNHMYFASHRSGCREILYKAGLGFIAANIDKIPYFNDKTKNQKSSQEMGFESGQELDFESNPEIDFGSGQGIYTVRSQGRDPESIIGYDVSIKLLRILNHPKMVKKLFSKESICKCRDVYRKYSGYIGNKCLSLCQWEYLEYLYDHNGTFAGHKFIRTLYLRLANTNDIDHLDLYHKFLIFKDEISGMRKLKIPKIEDVGDVVRNLEFVCRYKEEDDDIDLMIKKRNEEKHNYEYVGESFAVIMPKSLSDICNEAIAQGNCLMDYVKRHAEGESTILFIRKKNNINKSFITIEVEDHIIKQVYGKFNRIPEWEVFEFLKEYSRECWILCIPYDIIVEGLEWEELEFIDKEVRDYVLEYNRNLYERYEPECLFFWQMSLKDLYPEVFSK